MDLTSVIEKYAAAWDNPKELKTRQQKELQLWKEWKNSGESPNKLIPLLKSYKPLIESQAKVFKGTTPLPPAAVDAEFKKHFVTALKTYDPNRGAALNTHIHNHLLKSKRYIATYQNVARIPENRIYKIGEFGRAEDTLVEKLDRQPTDKELASYLKWSQKEVGRMRVERRKDLVTSRFEEDPFETTEEDTRLKEVMHMIYYQLTPEEKLVYDHTLGLHGKPKLFAGKIATTMGISAPKVSRLRNSIKNKMSKHL